MNGFNVGFRISHRTTVSEWIINRCVKTTEAKGVFMKAVMYENFSEMPKLVSLPDPIPENDSVVIKVKATGL